MVKQLKTTYHTPSEQNQIRHINGILMSKYTHAALLPSWVYVMKMLGRRKLFRTIIAEAMKTGAGTALIHIDFTAGTSEATATVTAET